MRMSFDGTQKEIDAAVISYLKGRGYIITDKAPVHQSTDPAPVHRPMAPAPAKEEEENTPSVSDLRHAVYYLTRALGRDKALAMIDEIAGQHGRIADFTGPQKRAVMARAKEAGYDG